MSSRFSTQRQDDIDRLSIQHELVELKKKVGDYKDKADDSEESLRLLNMSHRDALATIERLTADIKSERTRNVQLQHELKQAGNHKKTENDVRFMIPVKLIL